MNRAILPPKASLGEASVLGLCPDFWWFLGSIAPIFPRHVLSLCVRVCLHVCVSVSNFFFLSAHQSHWVGAYPTYLFLTHYTCNNPFSKVKMSLEFGGGGTTGLMTLAVFHLPREPPEARVGVLSVTWRLRSSHSTGIHSWGGVLIPSASICHIVTCL